MRVLKSFAKPTPSPFHSWRFDAAMLLGLGIAAAGVAALNYDPLPEPPARPAGPAPESWRDRPDDPRNYSKQEWAGLFESTVRASDLTGEPEHDKALGRKSDAEFEEHMSRWYRARMVPAPAKQ